MESTATITYLPGIGIKYNNITINWGSPRSEVRKIIPGKFEEKNTVTDLSIYNSGSSAFDIHQRRDAYHIINGFNCLFFLNYDKMDKLRDVEIHNGIELKLQDVLLSFDQEFNVVIQMVSTLSKVHNKLEDGVLFKDLKLLLASDADMGGSGDALGYIFLSNDMSHLI